MSKELAADQALADKAKTLPDVKTNPPSPKTPPKEPKKSAGEEKPPKKEKKIPPILDPGRVAEVRAETVKIVGSMIITFIGLFSILLIKGELDWAFFGILYVFNVKDLLTSFVSFLTGAKANALMITMQQAQDKADEEKEKFQQMNMDLNIENAKLRAEAEFERKMKEEVLKLKTTLK